VRSSPVTDSHGIQFSKPDADYLWAVDRADNKIIVINPTTDQIVNRINLVSRATGDPTPDLVRFSPDGTRAYVSLRGPAPLSGNNATVNNAKGSTPGLGVFDVTGNGLDAKLRYVHRTFNRQAGLETSDPHGIHVRTYEAP
jgi:DNA-binding beta-propeller fold protein YncE